MIGQDVGSPERRCARMYPEKTAAVCGDKRMTYSQLHDRINRCAQALAKLGVRKGDRVSMLLPNCSEYLEVDFALAKLGAIKVALVTRLHPNEWTSNIADCEANTLILEEGSLSGVMENLHRVPLAKNVIGVVTHPQKLPRNVLDYESLLANGTQFFGGTMAVSPDGAVTHPMEGAWDTEGTTYATFKAEDLYGSPAAFPQLRDWVPEAYRVLAAPPPYPEL